MPPFPGEERLVTVFADIHYYFDQPRVRPVLHRFDKGSYFYIYFNSTRQTSRIEIANNPGTPNQDAFNGYVDSCRVVNNEQFPTLLTIEVDGVTPASPTSPVSGRDPEEWCLASGDPRDANRTKFRLHTLDIYLWAQEDAQLVIECFRKLLPPHQLDVPEIQHDTMTVHDVTTMPLEHPALTAMSPVVQNLEDLAVTDKYNGGDHQQSAASPNSTYLNNLPPPPPTQGGQQIHSPSPAISDLSSKPGRNTSVRSSNKSVSKDFTPMAYNPAAPAAPEPIKHRVKTPPPENDGQGTGLAHAARNSQGYFPNMAPPPGGYQIGQGPPQIFGGGYASPAPPGPGGYSSPPPPPPQQQPGGYASSPLQQPGRHASPPPQQPGVQPPQHSSHYGSPPPPQPSSTAPTTGTSYSSPPQSTNYPHTSSQGDARSSMTSQAPSFGPGASHTPVNHSPNQGIHHTIPPPPGMQNPGQASTGQRHSTAADTYIPGTSQQQQGQGHGPGGQPVMTPGSQFYNSLPQPGIAGKPLAHVQPQYADYLSAGSQAQPYGQQGQHPQQQFGQPGQQQQPLQGGYSTYQYPSSAQASGQNPYDVHQQVYRPTEHEASMSGRHHDRKSSGRPGTGSGSQTQNDPGRKESRADKVEKGVGRLFKKIEKRIG